MRVSVLSVWRARREVVAGIDPLDVVDEAWSSMAADSFRSKGPFLPHALVVARNKAVDALRRGEAKRRDRSLDVPSSSSGETGGATLQDELPGSPGADVDYFRGLDQVAAIRKLALAEEAIYQAGVLSDIEREVFVAIRVHGKSRAAVGRELDPPITGQRVGQIAAQAFIKIQAFIRTYELETKDDLGAPASGGGDPRGRD